jgi:hypothetical protein
VGWVERRGISCWNEQVKKVFLALFTGPAGIVLAQVLDPAMTKQIITMIAGM